MKLNMYAVHDTTSQAYLTPFFMLHDAQAKRTFGDCINSRDHQFSAHPADYTLFNIGTFDDQGAAIGETTPISLGNGVEFINSEQSTRLEGLEHNEAKIRHDNSGTLRSSPSG